MYDEMGHKCVFVWGGLVVGVCGRVVSGGVGV